jgi:fimbrial isopeptide formation D2 family protein/LPXTG-motif cell wall-anchored protein
MEKSMKKIRKLLCMVMAMAMAFVTMFASCIGVMADSNVGTITIKSEEAGRTYQIYQIFTGNYSNGGILTDVEWGSALKGSGYDLTQTLVAKLKADSTIGSLFSTLSDTAPVAANLASALTASAFSTDDAEASQILANIIGEIIDSNSEKVSPFKTVSESKSVEGKYQYIMESVPYGYYIIDEEVPTTGTTTKMYTRWMLQVAGVSEILNAKSTTRPMLTDKVITKVYNTNTNSSFDPLDSHTSSAGIGDQVEFKITTTVPNMAGYRHYQYVVKDTMSSGLSYVSGSVTVKCDGVTVDPSKYEVTFDGTNGKIVFKDFLNNFKEYSGKNIEITYKALVTDTAYSTNNPETNKAKLVYSNDPTSTSTSDKDEPETGDITGETAEKTVSVYGTTIRIHKTDKEGRSLQGATFELASTNGAIAKLRVESGVSFEEDADGTYYKLASGSYSLVAPDDNTKSLYDADSLLKKFKRKVTTTVVEAADYTNGDKMVKVVDEGGYLYFEGLGAGTYTLTETVAPAGYNKLSAPVTFTISLVQNTESGSSLAPYYWHAAKEGDSGLVQINESSDRTYIDAEIKNTNGTTLPETGGMGTTVIYVLGAVLAVAAAILLITKKRMSTVK